MNINEILNKYNISEATLRNWKKLNFIDNINDIDPSIIENILKNKTSNRRNKRTSSNSIIPASYINDKRIINLIEKIISIKNKYTASVPQILHETIINILNKKKLKVPLDLDKILGTRFSNLNFKEDFQSIKFIYNDNNDFLGCLYMSLLSVGTKDTNGIFYTPFKVVDQIVSDLQFNKNSKIVDPGCGSGNFLIQIYKKMKNLKIPTANIIQNLYGYDIDDIAVLLAKINLYILDKKIVFEEINIYKKDFLNDTINEKFDIIVGNPPWGKKYTKNEKELLKEKYGLAFSKYDSFSQFILHSFDILNECGTLGFVLPSSILNIAVHKDIRKFLLGYKINCINCIGREFEEIVTDVVILNVSKDNHIQSNICLYNNQEILQNTFKDNPYYNFLLPSPIAINILEKIKNYPAFHLDKKDINYALGIVTGNNKKYLSDKKNRKNELIISGKDIDKYNINYSKIKKYITFDRSSFQQVAPDEFYRCQNKIIYKFIGKKLYFAVEPKGTLTLNSANLICFYDTYDIYYICAILNSRITQLFFEDIYDTHKLLKNHIQSFYIPNFKPKIKESISMLSKNTKPQSTYNEDIENIIYKELGLTENEINYLKGRFN